MLKDLIIINVSVLKIELWRKFRVLKIKTLKTFAT